MRRASHTPDRRGKGRIPSPAQTNQMRTAVPLAETISIDPVSPITS